MSILCFSTDKKGGKIPIVELAFLAAESPLLLPDGASLETTGDDASSLFGCVSSLASLTSLSSDVGVGVVVSARIVRFNLTDQVSGWVVISQSRN